LLPACEAPLVVGFTGSILVTGNVHPDNVTTMTAMAMRVMTVLSFVVGLAVHEPLIVSRRLSAAR
jgi:hypothetical protein